jgi:hypothetical protein
MLYCFKCDNYCVTAHFDDLLAVAIVASDIDIDDRIVAKG